MLHLWAPLPVKPTGFEKIFGLHFDARPFVGNKIFSEILLAGDNSDAFDIASVLLPSRSPYHYVANSAVKRTSWLWPPIVDSTKPCRLNNRYFHRFEYSELFLPPGQNFPDLHDFHGGGKRSSSFL